MIHEDTIKMLNKELEFAVKKFGKFNSTHELYAVLAEELEEFWDSVKKNEPSSYELIQLAIVAIRGYEELTILKKE